MRTLINGAGGRIGRAVSHETLGEKRGLRYQLDPDENKNPVSVVALNEPRGIDYVVKNYNSRDPVHGIYDWKVEKAGPNLLRINGLPVAFYAAKNLNDIPFKDLGLEGVLECSGFFGDPKNPEDKENLGKQFLNYGADTIIETYPAKTADKSIIMGVNHQEYDPSKHKIISNASCTTKALAMPLQVLLDNGIGIEGLSMDTTHAATASQDVLGSLSQIITHSTGAAKATGLVIPSLKGKMTGMSYRVPTLDGSFANLYFVATSDHDLTADEINDYMTKAVKNPKYAGRIGVHQGEDAGTFDIVGRRENSVVIPSKTNIIPLGFGPEGKKASLVTLIAGYDNELGSSVDPVLLARYIAEKKEK